MSVDVRRTKAYRIYTPHFATLRVIEFVVASDAQEGTAVASGALPDPIVVPADIIDGYILAWFSYYDTAGSDLISTAEFNGIPMEKLISGAGGNGQVTLFGLAVGNLLRGTYQITHTSAASLAFFTCGGAAYSGVNQFVPVGTAVTASGTGTAATVLYSSPSPGRPVGAIFTNSNGTITPYTFGQTVEGSKTGTIGIGGAFADGLEGSGYHAYTLGTSAIWTVASVPLKPATAGRLEFDIEYMRDYPNGDYKPVTGEDFTVARLLDAIMLEVVPDDPLTSLPFVIATKADFMRCIVAMSEAMALEDIAALAAAKAAEDARIAALPPGP